MPTRKSSMNDRGSEQNARVFNRDGWKCVYCGFDGRHETRYVFLEMDHLDPATKQHDDFDEQFDDQKVTSCNSCNKLKGGYKPEGSTRDEKLSNARAHVLLARHKLPDWFREHHREADSMPQEPSP